MQLVLPVAFSKQNGLETLVVGPNEALLSHLQYQLNIENMTGQASARICVIDGLLGSGKTHVLLAINDLAMSLGLSHQYINMNSMLNMPVEILEGASDNQVLCIDDIHTVRGNLAWQTGLFDLINQFVEKSNVLLLMSSQAPVNQLSLSLPDLRTRLQWGVNFSLKSLTDEDKLSALEKHAKALGVSFQDDALKYLINRASRNMHDLMKNLELLDKAALQNKRKLTIPFIKSVLDI